MESFEELLKESTFTTKNGLVKTRVISKTNDEIYLDLQMKTDRPIARTEFLPEEWEAINVGDEIEVLVIGGKPSYSKARTLIALNELKEAYEKSKPVAIKIDSKIKGGYKASYKGVSIFLPASQVGRKNVVEKNGTYNALIIKFREEDRDIVCSIMELEKKEKEKLVNRFFEAKRVGDIVRGKVKTIIDKGIFIDLGGFEGFIPFSELTYKRISSPKEFVRIGDEVTGKIIEMNKENKKVTISHKALEEDPWSRFLRSFKEGDKVEGTVRNMIKSGVFVEIVDGVDGFIHVSEISWTERVQDPKKYFKIGDKVLCLIKSIDEKNKRISLSFKEVLENPWDEFAKNFPPGTIVTGKVKDISMQGVVISLNDGLEGFIPNEYISWNRIEESKNSLSLSQELNVKVMDVKPEKRKIVLSLRDMTPDPWLRAKECIKEKAEIEGTLTGFNEKFVFFEVLPDVEGIVRRAEFEKGKKEMNLKVGDKMTLLVMEFDFDKRRLLLSREELEKKEEKEALNMLKNQNNAKVTLADFIKK